MLDKVKPKWEQDFHNAVVYSADGQGYSVRYNDYVLSSVFQPIFSVAHRRPIGFEALIRARDSQTDLSLSPQTLFKQATSSAEHLTLDRLCRSLHMHNFTQTGINDEWLFINLDSQCLANEKPIPGFMSSLFSSSDIQPEHVVIEILESEINDRAYLKSLIAHFRAMGCLIAIDDFGAGHSNFDRVWELEPDIVKIDRKLIERAETSSKIKRILKGIVSLIHEAGSLVVIEGIETEKQALIAIEANADMVQGYYFAVPSSKINPNQIEAQLDHLLTFEKDTRTKTHRRLTNHFNRFESLFKQAIDQYALALDHDMASEILFQEKEAVRSYVLDEAGTQIGTSIEAPGYSEHLNTQFKPLFSSDNANWSNKHYHYQAMQNLNQMQVSRLYLSTVGRHMCITVSQAIEVDSKVYVLCCDLYWTDD
jgi:EAL domain-containing protein (putative c-di-GMP-specific phosphodiesterase class I)